MKRILASLTLLAPVTLLAFSTWSGCGSDTSTAGTAGDDPALASCSSAPLCDPIVLPAACSSDGKTIVCKPGALPGDAGADASDDASAGDASADASAGDAGAGDAGAGDAGPGAVQLGASASANLQCALEALRGQKTGGLAVLIAEKGSPTCGGRFEIVSFGDGSISLYPVAYCDDAVTRGQATRRALPSTSFFDACLASPDDAKRIDCLNSVLTAESKSGGTCTCRGIHDDPARGLCRSL